MTERNNRFLSCLLQLVSLGFFVLSLGFFCSVLWVKSGITISTTPPKTVPAVVAPTATPSSIYVILTEQARAEAKVQVITAGTGIFWAWYAVPAGFIITGLGIGYVGLRYGLRGQDG